MSQLSELHLLRARITELEATVDLIDRGQQKHEMKLRDKLFADLVVKFAIYQPDWEFRDAVIHSAAAWADEAVRSFRK